MAAVNFPGLEWDLIEQHSQALGSVHNFLIINLEQGRRKMNNREFTSFSLYLEFEIDFLCQRRVKTSYIADYTFQARL